MVVLNHRQRAVPNEGQLEAVGGTRPVWLALIALVQNPDANQREIAAQIGIRDATLTHHLAAMEADGLIERTRDPDNRRVHRISLTDAGREAFQTMASAAIEFDEQLRSGITDDEQNQLEKLLERLEANVS